MTPLAATEAERLAFETWARPWYILGKNERGDYDSQGAYIAWFAWQAARALQQTAEPVAMVIARERARQLGRAGMEFAANLCMLGTVTIKGVDYVRRDTVMNEAIEWREKFNKAPDIPRPAAPDRAPSTDSAADARDAARYRWLVQKFEVTALPCFLEAKLESGYIADGKASIDTFIDAAIAASLPQTKEE